ncbi:hypothetical protein EON73_05705 [bacterium]|nr:MAG: hypothetical protein EON73_05705 [bacterium]
MYKEIQRLFQDLLSTLVKKKISYQDLKSALVPRSDRNEIAFVFDTALIESSWYGYEVFKILIPLLEKDSSNSILCGDYIGEERFREFLKSIFFAHIQAHKNVNYLHHGLFYIVYINNLSDKHFSKLKEGLNTFEGYVGYFDLNYASPIKTFLSTILTRPFLKSKNTILNASEGNEDVNMTGYPFEPNGYKVKGVDELCYGLFLSYKIEREIFSGYETDTLFSLNAITENVLDISDFELLIEENKLEYLLKEKADNLKRAGMANFSTQELEQLIKNKIRSNYIYNLSYLSDFKTTKFNILIETPRTDNNIPMKLTVALEYKALEKTLRLITMF